MSSGVGAVIVAAGRGTRMGSGGNKLFLEVAGAPIVAHTWARFDGVTGVDELVLVTRPELFDAFHEMSERFGFRRPYRLVAGGAERQESVWNGLEALGKGVEIVAIQDAARPCADGALIAGTIQAAREHGAAVAAQRMVDTVKEASGEGFIQVHLDRSKIWTVQTPQTFRREVIERALAAVRAAGAVVTDDTAACEFIGQPVKLVESVGGNPKATSRADLPALEVLLQNSALHCRSQKYS